MLSKAVVAAVALLAAVAVGDAVRQSGLFRDEPEARTPVARTTRWRIDRGPTPCRSLVPGACGRYRVLDGAVTRDDEPFLDRGDLARAFPGAPPAQPVGAFRVARAPDGALAVAVLDGLGRGAVELWAGRRPVARFRVPARSFRAGLGWSPAGDLVATYPRRGRPTLYDRSGARVAEVGWNRRPG
jgi:hypothetical protein